MERPHTLKSGTALQSSYSVHHRSDILLQEQVEAVKKSQTDLKRAISELDTVKEEEELTKLRENVAELKEKAEKALLVLQVLSKVNVELQFARAELDEALEKQEGDINEARKRVMWLEDRMGKLCGKARLRGQVTHKPKKSLRSSADRLYDNRLDTASESDSEEEEYGRGRGQMNKKLRQVSIYTPSDSGSEFQQFSPTARRGMADSSSSSEASFVMAQQLASQRRGLDDSDSESDQEMPEPTSTGGQPQPSGPVITSQIPQTSSGMDGHDTVDTKETTERTELSQDDDKDGGQRETESPVSVTDTQVMETDASILPQVGMTMGEGYSVLPKEEEETEAEEAEVDQTVDDSVRSETAANREGEGQHLNENATFMTEPTFPKEKSVTINVPYKPSKEARDGTELTSMFTREQTTAPEEDRARDYWYSEHHRFEYSEYSEALLELDPLSYHQVGLAVPGSFIQKPNEHHEELPWRPKSKTSEINDVHKIALNKLTDRVHTMYGKLYDAAQLSVRSRSYVEPKKEMTMFSSFDGIRDGARSGTPLDTTRPGMVTAPSIIAPSTPRPQTTAEEIIPSKVRTGLNVYHPKPIPPPEVLPLTRISKDKEFPRLSNQFYDPDDILSHKPAVRIANQRNLHKETKLKLFRDRPKRADDGPSSMEKRFRMMIEEEKTMASRSSSGSKSNNKGLTATRLTMLTRAITNGSTEIKPGSREKEYSGLKWERVKTLVHVYLASKKVEERRDAAKHLGLLRCGDGMVFFALKERLKIDEDSRTRYEAAKSLILLGCWDEYVLQVIVKYLVIGNTEIRQDLIHTMIDGKNVQYVNKKNPTFPEIVKVLSHFCFNPDPDDTIAFDAAILLGKFCVMDKNAKNKLLLSLEQSDDTHIKAKALETLVKQLNSDSWDVVQHLLALFKESSVWRYRALAADLLIVLGRDKVCKPGEEEKIYHILERKLWDDPNREVRVSAAKALTALGMFGKACEHIEKKLEHTDEDIRAQAVISVGTLEMKSEKIVRLLLEMLELDASEYVRLMIARTFAILKLTDKRVLRALRERDKVDGALAREARKALKALETLVSLPRLISPTGRKSIMTQQTMRLTPAVSR